MTMYLKIICNSLSRRPHALDAMLQFSSPQSILQPLCRFLDEWRYEDAQGTWTLKDSFDILTISRGISAGV